MTGPVSRLCSIAAAVACLLAAPGAAGAQTFPLTLHMSGTVHGRASVVGYGGGLCDYNGTPTQCVFQMVSGVTVRLAATAPGGQTPGLLSAGTGPAAACGFSACTFTMSAAADVNVSFSGGNGPVANITVTLAGDGRGTVSADNTRCQNIDPPEGSACATAYLQGSPASIGAVGGPASRFFAYSGGTGGAGVCATAAQCDFTITGPATVTGTFHAMTSLAVTPASAAKLVGGTQTFAAMGTFSDGVTETILPGMGAWVTVASLPTVRYSLAAAATSTRVYAVGGIEAGAPGASMTEFNPSTNTWTPRLAMPTPREQLSAVTTGGFIYAIGGNTVGSVPVATVERYDPGTNTWSARAPLAAPRRGLAAGVVNGIIYAVGGETVSGAVSTTVATVEAYDPATNTWTVKASMPSARNALAVAVVDNILYAIGGGDATGSLATVEAYNPATNTWTAKAPMPSPLSNSAAAAVEGAIYVMGGGIGGFAAYAYDPVQNTWSNKLNMPTGRGELAAAALNGVVYAVGGLTGATTATSTSKVESFIESLRWSSTAPGVARVSQQGTATAITPGTATIDASVGSFICSSCATFNAYAAIPTDMALEAPTNNSTLTRGASFTVSGWAINRAAPSGTGIDAVHVYAVPSSGPSIFLGVATYGFARSDIGATYGSQFTNSGFSLTTGASLAAGSYTIYAYAHNALVGGFDAARSANILLTVPVSNGLINIDAPTPGQVVTSAFEIGGWAIDRGAPTGSGVDGVQFYVQPAGAPAVFIGTGSVGGSRPDVGAVFGSQFSNAGFHFTITGLGPGSYTLGVYAHSTVTGSFSIVKTLPFSVNANQLMSIDLPSPEATITGTTFTVAGWSIDRTAAGLDDTGVDALHVYAYPNPGSGAAPIFLGVATYGIARSDVGAAYGANYTNSGYQLDVNTITSGLVPGVYSIVVHSHSTSGAFNNLAVVRVTIQ